MFIDEAVISVKAGDGGNGCHSYERLKYKSKGRPAGGDGGRGGNVYLLGSSNITTLQDVAYKQTYKAGRGDHGKGMDCAGRSGEDVIITVPLGTVVYDELTKEIVVDCLSDGQQERVARGGRGGRGNAALVSPKNPNPEMCEAGKPGEEKKLRFVLKVLADVGLVGRPNAGKSTFLSKISAARPKIADYPFTTKEPNLGIVRGRYGQDSFVVADIPGLIEDCHKGKGLGIRFLRHIERTKLLAILVEATHPDPIADANVLLNELALYSKDLADKPKCFILTKKDLITEEISVSVPKGWFFMSAVTNEGLDDVLKTISSMVKELKSKEAEDDSSFD
jgi:GTP-binding protein